MYQNVSPSSRGLGHRVLIPATWVRIPLEMPVFGFAVDFCRPIPCRPQAAGWSLPTFPCRRQRRRQFSRSGTFAAKKWDCSLFVGCLAYSKKSPCGGGRAASPLGLMPSAVKSIFRRPRSTFLIGFALIVTASKVVFIFICSRTSSLRSSSNPIGDASFLVLRLIFAARYHAARKPRGGANRLKILGIL